MLLRYAKRRKAEVQVLANTTIEASLQLETACHIRDSFANPITSLLKLAF